MIHRRLAFLLLVLGVLTGIFAARLPAMSRMFASGWPGAVSDVADLIVMKHVSPPAGGHGGREALYEAAIHAMVDLLDDPYSEFVPPAARGAFEKKLTGEFAGIGASIAMRDGWPVISTPLPGSPAAAAGILPGDRVVAVDGASLKGLSLDEGIDKVVGEPGTAVRLSIQRRENGAPGTDAPWRDLEITVTRGAIVSPSVQGFSWNRQKQAYDFVIDPTRKIAYLRLEQFTPALADQMREAINVVRSTHGPGAPAGLIIDLRDNPGGLLDMAVELAGLFVKDGVIVSTKDRDGKGESLSVSGSPVLPDVPMVILVNESSASASEILAGGLQEMGRAVVVGTRTYGKGLVQIIEDIPSLPGAQLKLTEQRYYLPSGRLIHRVGGAKVWGVDPSPGFYVPMTLPQRQEAFLVRERATAVWPASIPAPVGSGPDWSSPDSIASAGADPQLAAALKAVQIRVDGGAWTPTGGTMPADLASGPDPDERSALSRQRQSLIRELARVERRLDEAQGDAASPARPQDLWADETEVKDGFVDVFDKNGKRIARLRITGPNLEAWLLEADVKPEPEPTP